MKKTYDTIKYNPLFADIDFGDFEKMLTCMSATTKFYKKDEIILLSGNKVDSVGLILQGNVRVIKEDAEGNGTILTELTSSELFGEVFACAGISHSPVTVQAGEECKILFIDYKKIIFACASSCPFHLKLIENMLKILARKNLILNQKIEILSKRSTREKLRSFFDICREGSNKFIIPYNREELAQYLCVDRSAMSNELCKMRNEGLIKFSRNKFEIL